MTLRRQRHSGCVKALLDQRPHAESPILMMGRRVELTLLHAESDGESGAVVGVDGDVRVTEVAGEVVATAWTRTQ